MVGDEGAGWVSAGGAAGGAEDEATLDDGAAGGYVFVFTAGCVSAGGAVLAGCVSAGGAEEEGFIVAGG